MKISNYHGLKAAAALTLVLVGTSMQTCPKAGAASITQPGRVGRTSTINVPTVTQAGYPGVTEVRWGDGTTLHGPDHAVNCPNVRAQPYFNPADVPFRQVQALHHVWKTPGTYLVHISYVGQCATKHTLYSTSAKIHILHG